ncbi:MAG: hypothetical protein J5803_01355, partial [Desulfovibrio sp.]|nr:hypothetical protein [Desulfovibrio sp.]
KPSFKKPQYDLVWNIMTTQSSSFSWSLWRARRIKQVLIGRISAFFFLLAIFALLDGLQMLVRTDTTEIRLLAGESEGVSGPCPFQNPVQSDLEVSFIPKDAPLHFELEGFFAGYLLGNGMWRGRIIAPENVATQDCQLLATFRGMTEGQRFSLHIFANDLDARASSPSFILRFTGFQPFIVAAFLGAFGLIVGLFSFYFGRKNLALLKELGHAEIFRTSPAHTDPMILWCSANGEADIQKGNDVAVKSEQGKELGIAHVKTIEKNVLCLSMPYNRRVRCGCLVDLQTKTHCAKRQEGG